METEDEVFYSGIPRRMLQIGPDRNCERPLDAKDLIQSVSTLIESEYWNEEKKSGNQPFLVDHVFINFRAGIADVILRENREDYGVSSKLNHGLAKETKTNQNPAIQEQGENKS